MRNETGPIRVAVMGLGHIGLGILSAALRDPELQLVGAIDPNPSLAGKPLSEFLSGAPSSMRVQSKLAPLLKELSGGVLLQATEGTFEELLPSLQAAARAGACVISTCEELAYPWLAHEEEADALDQLAQRSGISILGTGLNPGFALDRLVATAGQVLGPVARARATLQCDLLALHRDLWSRMGFGLTEQEFEERAERGEVGKRGLVESAALAALGLGLDVDEYDEELTCAIAKEPLGTEPPLAVGRVAGLFQRASAFLDGKELVTLEFECLAAHEAPRGRIVVDGDFSVEIIVPGGYPQESATIGTVLNAARRITAAEPGVLTVLDLPAGR